jgi:hypothetical protein
MKTADSGLYYVNNVAELALNQQSMQQRLKAYFHTSFHQMLREFHLVELAYADGQKVILYFKEGAGVLLISFSTGMKQW